MTVGKRNRTLRDKVAQSGKEIVVSKRGRRITKLPIDNVTRKSLRSSVIRGDDIVDPFDLHWRVNK